MAEPLSALADGPAYLGAVTLISHLDPQHPLHRPCTGFLTRAVDPRHPIDLVTASLTFDEIAIVLLQESLARPPFSITRNRTQYLGRHPDVVKQLTETLGPLLGLLRDIVSVEPVIPDDIPAMLETMRQHGLLPRDAIHVAVARRIGTTAIVSDDDAFDRVPGIRLFKP